MSKSSREADRVISKLSQQLSNNTLKVGDKLPTEAQLCKEFDVSRTVVREALQQLKAIGVLTTITGSGSYVSEISLNGMMNSLEFYATMTGDSNSWIELLDIRSLLESSCARKLAGENYTDKGLAKLKEALEDMANNQEDIDLFGTLDVKFHQVLIQASGSKITLAFLNSLKKLQLRFTKETYREESKSQLIERNLKEHTKIVEAIENRDPEAAELAMKEHLSATRQNLLHYIKKHSG